VFLIGVNVASSPHYLVFFGVQQPQEKQSSLDVNAKGRWDPIERDWHSARQDFEVLNCVKW
jgi:hypothetical protein